MAAGFKTGGRQVGTPNKATAQLKELILEKTENGSVLVKKLFEWLDSESETLRTSAMKLLLEYGFGKPKEHIEHSGTVEVGLGQMFDEMAKKKQDQIKLAS